MATMLTLGDIRHCFFIFSVYGRLGIFPLDFSFSDGRVSRVKGPRVLLHRVIFLFFLSQALSVNVSLIRKLTGASSEGMNSHTFLVHVDLVVGTILMTYMYVMYFYKHPDLTVSLYELWKQSAGRHEAEAKRKPWEYSMVQQQVLNMPVSMIPGSVVTTVMCFLDPSLSSMGISIIPDVDGLGILTVAQVLFFVGFLNNMATFMLQTQALFFEYMTDGLEGVKGTRISIEAGGWAAGVWLYKKKYMNLRRLHLSLNLFNRSHCYVIYVLKLSLLQIGMYNLSYAILVSATHPFIAYCYAGTGVVAVATFTITYGTAHSIPESFGQRVTELQTSVKLTRMNATKRDYLLKALGSVPSVGVQLGHFYTFQRESTLEYLDFLVSNVTSTVMTVKLVFS